MNSVWVVTFHDSDGNGGTHSYVVHVASSELLANEYVAGRSWPRDWYTVDEFGVDGV